MFKQKRTLIIVVVGLIAVGGVLFLRQSRIFQKVIPSQKDECIEQDNACCKKDGICRQLNLLCEEGLEPEIKGCSPDCTPIAECVPKQGGLKIPNPASVFCQKQNGKIEIKEDEQGNQYSLCIFEDGSVCEEWALFREECKKGEKTCLDLCGDGICQEIVCLAVGCPCAETPENCAQDCQ